MAPRLGQVLAPLRWVQLRFPSRSFCGSCHGITRSPSLCLSSSTQHNPRLALKSRPRGNSCWTALLPRTLAGGLRCPAGPGLLGGSYLLQAPAQPGTRGLHMGADPPSAAVTRSGQHFAWPPTSTVFPCSSEEPAVPL